MNYSFDIAFYTKTITKRKQSMWEFKKHYSAALQYYASDQCYFQYFTINDRNVLSSIVPHCNMQMSLTTSKEG